MPVYDVVVMGAGPAGLAVAASLKQAGVTSLLVLEQGSKAGWRWHQHYDRLHLHTARYASALPGLAFPKGTPLFPSKQQVIAYLESYAQRFDLKPVFGESVTQVVARDAQWLIRTRGGSEYAARNLIIATGRNNHIKACNIKGQETFPGLITHSRNYQNARSFADQKVLVVGAGNTGAEIALDLAQGGAETHLCVRSPVHVVPREIYGLPTQITNIFLSKLPGWLADRIALASLRANIGNLSKYGLKQPHLAPRQHLAKTGRVPIIDVGTLALIKEGRIKVRPAIESIDGAEVLFSDGSRESFSRIILATGYENGLDKIFDPNLLDQSSTGTPTLKPLPGLFSIGYHDSGLGTLWEIKREAVAIAAAVAKRVGASHGMPANKGRFAWIQRMGIHQAYHRQPINRLIHLACIPFELWGFLKILSLAKLSVPPVDLALVTILLLAPVYLLTEALAGGLMVIGLLGLWASLPLFGQSTLSGFAVGLAALLGGLMIQTRIGHDRFEAGRDDTKRNVGEFLSTLNPIPLVLIFYFHFLEILLALGYRPKLKAQIKAFRDLEMRSLEI